MVVYYIMHNGYGWWDDAIGGVLRTTGYNEWTHVIRLKVIRVL
jgi:hypothetical protein